MSGFVIIFFVIAALVIVGGILAAKHERERRQALAALAARRGWSFDPSTDSSLMDRFPEFKCLRAGDQARYAYNRINGGLNGRGLLAFDYHYETVTRDSKGNPQTSSHTFSAVMLTSDVPLQPLLIRPETFGDRISAFFGFEDINFESDEFSRAFHVTSPDRKWAYDVIHPRMMEYLMAAPRLSIQFDHQYMMVWGNARFSVEEFEQAIAFVAGIFDRMPDYLVRAQRDRNGG